MRHSAALTAVVSCVCQMHQRHRYLKRHPRRSMLLPQHARHRWLANCRPRCGSSLVQGRGREKRNRAGVWLGLIPNSFPATTRQVSTERLLAQYYRGASCEWTGFHTTEQWRSRESRSLRAGRSNSCFKKYTYPANSSAVLSKYLSRFLNCDCSVCPTIYPYQLSNNPKSCPNH